MCTVPCLFFAFLTLSWRSDFQDGHFLAAGSRDRYINVLDLNKIDKHDEDSLQKCRTFCKVDAHKV